MPFINHTLLQNGATYALSLKDSSLFKWEVVRLQQLHNWVVSYSRLMQSIDHTLPQNGATSALRPKDKAYSVTLKVVLIIADSQLLPLRIMAGFFLIQASCHLFIMYCHSMGQHVPSGLKAAPPSRCSWPMLY